ncbi:hypothetical protein TIFTF001_028761 [Ficus carica]|uniref:Uncharacterized protein n=1 Tax=Ficus carica TaxID=3494 RepID=A0AA88DQJ8_FICCA|nr:hypothetical protein TIFTF001_028761 [Ficus carica]
MGVVKMAGSDGGGCVRKREMESEDRNEDTCGWTVENGFVGGHSTGEIRNFGSMNLQLRSIGALDPPIRPSLHAHRRRSRSNRRPSPPYLLGNNQEL